MFFILSNVPVDADKQDIRRLVQQFSSVESMKSLNDQQSSMSEYLIELEEDNRVVVDAVVSHFNHYYWNSRVLAAHCPLFQ